MLSFPQRWRARCQTGYHERGKPRIAEDHDNTPREERYFSGLKLHRLVLVWMKAVDHPSYTTANAPFSRFEVAALFAPMITRNGVATPHSIRSKRPMTHASGQGARCSIEKHGGAHLESHRHFVWSAVDIQTNIECATLGLAP